uniref:Uncharacterized protein n=1 Tax=Arundo donax TaxID=35708 RepID=A0A0A9ADP3_ARUDO
MLRQQTNSSVS